MMFIQSKLPFGDVETVEPPTVDLTKELPSKLVFGDVKHIALAHRGNAYAEAKSKYPMVLNIGSDTYECQYPCANCGLSNLESILNRGFRKKKVSDKTKRTRLANVLFQTGLVCRSCGTKHKIIKSDFSVLKIKIKDGNTTATKKNV